MKIGPLIGVAKSQVKPIVVSAKAGALSTGHVVQHRIGNNVNPGGVAGFHHGGKLVSGAGVRI